MKAAAEMQISGGWPIGFQHLRVRKNAAIMHRCLGPSDHSRPAFTRRLVESCIDRRAAQQYGVLGPAA